MSSTHATPSALAGGRPTTVVPTIPVRAILPWLFFGWLLALVVIFFISADQGAVALPAGNAIHEWVHDGRHLLGYPCH